MEWGGSRGTVLCLITVCVYLHRSEKSKLIVESSSWIHEISQTFQPLTTPILFLICLLGLYNIATALLPLIRNTDELTDIPLTPTQRSLLGLDPNATPPLTPGTQYITPPRYPHSPTPRNISPATRSTSTYSTPITSSPSFGRERSGSPTASLAASPLWQKSLGKSRDTARRSSYGSPSPLGPGFGGSNSILGAPNTPSPAAGRGATVGLNNKWLYQKGRSASGSRYPSIYSGTTLVDY